MRQSTTLTKRPSEPANATTMLPLAAGHRWTYEIRERTGAGTRILLIATSRPRDVKLADWTFEIGEPTDGRYPATLVRTPLGDALPSTTELQLWERDGTVWMDAGTGERPAIEARLPPDPVSSERVRCVAHMLGGVVGTCPPVPGGPLGTAPGLDQGIVAQDLRPGAAVAQFLVGVASAGLFIPGNPSAVQTATLTAFTPGPGSEAIFQARPGGAVEQAAARVAQAPRTRTIRTADREMAALPEGRRYPVLRTAIPRAMEGGVVAVARLRSRLPDRIPPAHADAIRTLFEDQADRDAVTMILAGDQPLFTEVVARTPGSFDQDRLAALDEALAICPVTEEGAVAVVGLFGFDDGRRDAIERLLPRFPPERRAAALSRMFEKLRFDSGRLALLRDHADLLKTLPLETRRALAAQVIFHEDEARSILGL